MYVTDRIMKHGNYQKLINEIFYPKNHEPLNDKELLLYFYLLMIRNYKENVLTIPFKKIADNINFTLNKKNNRDHIEKRLKELHGKEYIQIKQIEQIEDAKIRKGNLVIQFPKANPDTKYTPVSNQFLSVVKNAKEFSLLVYILMELFKSKGKPIEISISQFQKHLLNQNNKPMSRENIRKTLDELEQRGLVDIVRGRFFKTEAGQINQEANKYMIKIDNILDSADDADDLNDLDSVDVADALDIADVVDVANVGKSQQKKATNKATNKAIHKTKTATSKTNININIKQLEKDADAFVSGLSKFVTVDEYIEAMTHSNPFVPTIFTSKRVKNNPFDYREHKKELDYHLKCKPHKVAYTLNLEESKKKLEKSKQMIKQIEEEIEEEDNNIRLCSLNDRLDSHQTIVEILVGRIELLEEIKASKPKIASNKASNKASTTASNTNKKRSTL